MLQSRDRIHRLGLEESQKTYYYMILNGQEEFFNTIDLKIYKRLIEKKEAIQKKAIENNEIIPLTDDMLDDIKARGRSNV